MKNGIYWLIYSTTEMLKTRSKKLKKMMLMKNQEKKTKLRLGEKKFLKKKMVILINFNYKR